MFLHHVVFLLMSWPYVKSAEDGQGLDQVATASENISLHTELPNASRLRRIDQDIHFENSNGFHPISLVDDNENSENQSTSTNTKFSNKEEFKKRLQEEPEYSVGARILMNLPQSGANRRSFENSDNPNEFEILKVTKDTPAVANYDEFYENVGSSFANENESGEDYKIDSDRHASRSRTAGESKQFAGNHASHTGYDLNQGNRNGPRQYYTFSSRQKAPQTNEQDDYDQQNTKHETRVLNFENFNSDSSSNRNHNRYSKPVVVADPGNYKIELNFNQQAKNTEISTSSPYRNIESNKSLNRYGHENSREAPEDSDYDDSDNKSRRLRKSRRRPYNSDSSRRLPKEHRSSSTKYNRQRNKQNSWSNEDRDQEDNYNAKSQENSWNQVAPNVEVSHSTGYELKQNENQNLILPVNLVPLASFDHATALGNSQGFDVSNAVLQNFVTGTSLLSTPSPVSTTAPSEKPVGLGTSVPDIIVGQSSFHNPAVSAVLISNNPHKYSQNVRAHYMQSTVTPVIAVTSSMNAIQSTATPRPSYTATTPVSISQMPVIVPQPTLTNFVQTPGFIHINPHGLHGQSVPSATQSSNGNGEVTSNSHNSQHRKNNFNGQNGQLLASASFSVGNSIQKQGNNYLQTVPVLHTGTEIGSIQANNHQSFQEQQRNLLFKKQRENEQLLKAANQAFENSMKELQRQIQKHQDNRNEQLLAKGYYNNDNHASNSNTNSVNSGPPTGGQAQLPAVRAKNVEIVNPNIKPSPVDFTFVNTLGLNNYPTAVLTTPIPIFSSTTSVPVVTSFVTARPVVTPTTHQPITVQSFIDSLTEVGAKGNQGAPLDFKINNNRDSGNQPMFNPINFVPNNDVLNNQNMLNSKVNSNEPLQQSLNLVPMMPGGNFFKQTQAAHIELLTKPKLHTDLAKHAEEMFKESLKTMYNTQQWNNDRKVFGNYNSSDPTELIRFRNDLQRLKSAISDTKNRDILEAHHTENKIRTARPTKSKENTNPEIEQLIKNHHHPGSYRNKGHGIRNFLTPPKLNSFVSKSPIHAEPVKKRPHRNQKGASSRPRKHKPSGPEAAASSNMNVGVRNHRFKEYKSRPSHDDFEFKRPYHRNPSYHSLPTFTTSSPIEFDPFKSESKPYNLDYLNLNHRRMHNLFGLLMKNKQLPDDSTSTTETYLPEAGELTQFFDNDRPAQPMSFLDFQKKSDSSRRVFTRKVQRNRTRLT